MKILFVDDEPRVLDGLRRTLFDSPPDWEVRFARSAEEALDAMLQSHFDVIVSDLKMPGTDGPTLLRQVHARYPEVIRIALSGQVDEATCFQMIPTAHQYLSKPCNCEDLKSVFERAGESQRLLTNPRARALVGGIRGLPSSPKVFAELTNLLGRADASIDEIVDVVARDPGVTAKVMALVNSSFFCRGPAVQTLRAAVVRLGLRQIRLVTACAEAFAIATPSATLSFPLERLEQRALLRASIAAHILESHSQRGLGEIAAMLCDIGLFVLAVGRPDEFETCLLRARRTGCTPDSILTQHFDASPTSVAAYFLGLWGLPTPLVSAVATQRLPPPAADPVGLHAATYLATCLVDGQPVDDAWEREANRREMLDSMRANIAPLPLWPTALK